MADDVVLREVGRIVEGILRPEHHRVVAGPHRRAHGDDGREQLRVGLGGQQSAVAAHRPADDRTFVPAAKREAAGARRDHLTQQHAEPVLAGGALVPVRDAAADADHGIGRRLAALDELRGVIGEAYRRPAAATRQREADRQRVAGTRSRWPGDGVADGHLGMQLLQRGPDLRGDGGALQALSHIALHRDGIGAALTPQHARFEAEIVEISGEAYTFIKFKRFI